MAIHVFAVKTPGALALTLPIPRRSQLTSMNGDRMLVKGWERIGNQDEPDAKVQAQEWSIQIMLEQPAELARTSHRPPVYAVRLCDIRGVMNDASPPHQFLQTHPWQQ